MSSPRRDFVKACLSAGAFSGLISLAESRAMGAPFGEENAQENNPGFDLDSYKFWSDFLASDAVPIVRASGQTRGGGLSADNELQPVFMHYGTEGFRNAAELDASKLISEGDVKVSLNTSILKISTQDLATFQKFQNAQVRVDVMQKTPILPVLEAMGYTIVSGMVSLRSGKKPPIKSKSKSGGTSSGSPQTGSSKSPFLGGKSSLGSLQNISAADDPAWQKMQNIILPGGEGRWALNLEAQRKDSLFFKLFQDVIKASGQFVPMIGLPGIAMTALQSFNVLYGALHAEPVSIFKMNPMRVFATQKSYGETGMPGSAQGILLQNGTYIQFRASQTPTTDELKNLTVMQGRIVPPKTPLTEVDSAAADTLKDVTYATFEVGVSPATIFTGNVVKPAQQ